MFSFVFLFLIGSRANNRHIYCEWPVFIQCLDSRRPFQEFSFKQPISNYYDKLLHLWSLLVSFANTQFINCWCFALVSAQAKKIPATSHNQNGAAITSSRRYKERCGHHIFLQNTHFSMASWGLQAEYSTFNANMPQPLLLSGGSLHYTWCRPPKLAYPWLLIPPPFISPKDYRV